MLVLLLPRPPLPRLPLSEPGLVVETEAVVEAADTERGEEPLRSRSRDPRPVVGVGACEGGSRPDAVPLEELPLLPLSVALVRPIAFATSL